MVDEEELHDSLPGLACHVTVCLDTPTLHDGHRARRYRLHGGGGGGGTRGCYDVRLITTPIISYKTRNINHSIKIEIKPSCLSVLI